MADDEVVALYDEAGEVAGSAPRSVMRARNLRHAASSIVVRDPLGPDLPPPAHDDEGRLPGSARLRGRWRRPGGGGPAVGAVREVEEELGVAGVPLEPLGVADYADEHTRYRAFRFVVTWDGPIRWQPEEVSWGEWVTVEELVRRLDEEAESIVPDSVAVWSATCGRGTRAGSSDPGPPRARGVDTVRGHAPARPDRPTCWSGGVAGARSLVTLRGWTSPLTSTPAAMPTASARSSRDRP